MRYLSLDVFRGLTIALMIIVNTPGSWTDVYGPFLHASWHGCTPTDLVFPSFVFAIGLSMVFSFSRYDYRLTAPLALKILKRTALIYLIYVLLMKFPFSLLFDSTGTKERHLSDVFDFSTFRILGVLPRLALTYGICSFIVLLIPARRLGYVAGAFLLGYWGIMAAFGDPSAPYAMLTNAAHKLDLILLGERHLYSGEGVPFDPEGLLSTLPTLATCLFGYLAGWLIKHAKNPLKVVQILLTWGAAGILLGMLWNGVFPINKKLWTSSYVVYVAGIDAVILAALVYMIDIRGQSSWTFFFKVLGMNALAAYILSEGITIFFGAVRWLEPDGKVMNLHFWLYQNLFLPLGSPKAASSMFAVAFMLLNWVILWGMYRRKMFFKV